MSVDTSTEAVALLIRRLERTVLYDGSGEKSDLLEAAYTTIRALVAERDAANLTCDTAIKAVTKANAERDAARAEEREACALAVEQYADQSGRDECCGNVQGYDVPECCGQPYCMIDVGGAKAAIRARKEPQA